MRATSGYILPVILAAAGVAASLCMKAIGFPNYVVGVFLGVVLAYYLSGLRSAAICYVLSVIGLAALAFPPIGLAMAETSDWLRLAGTTVATAATCFLLWRLRLAHRGEAELIEELEQSHSDMADELRCEQHVGETLQRVFLP